MAKTKYSEDYERLIAYKQSVSSENYEMVKKETVIFFFDKYQNLIDYGYKTLKNKLSNGVSLEGKVDFEEFQNFDIELPPKKYFYKRIKSKYIPQALDSFKPEVITNKSSYNFSTYMYNYIRHASRNIATKWQKTISKMQKDSAQTSIVDEITNEEEAKRINEGYAMLRKKLDELELQVLDALVAGKKQKNIIIINERTKKPYSKGYISKLVKKIRAIMKKLLDS